MFYKILKTNISKKKKFKNKKKLTIIYQTFVDITALESVSLVTGFAFTGITSNCVATNCISVADILSTLVDILAHVVFGHFKAIRALALVTA